MPRRPVRIDADFPGGNIVVERWEGEHVWLHQDLRDTTTWWFYWHFRARNIYGRTVRFHFTNGDVMSAAGPAYSLDGKPWQWLGAANTRADGFDFTFAQRCREARFCFSIPYLQADWEAFAARIGERKGVKHGVLCTTRKGRPVETLSIKPTRRARAKLLVTCRHHCCEMMASYVLEGLLDAVIRDPAGAWLRENVDVFAVPFMDKDGVEDGDQGKNRAPRDHNRDYSEKSVHLETAAMRRKIPAWLKGLPFVGMDFHCPYVKGGRDDSAYFVGHPGEGQWGELQRFSAILEATREGPVPFHASDNLEYGKEWNVRTNEEQGMGFGRWVWTLPGIILATALETTYSVAHGVLMTPDGARGLGRDIARALGLYLQEKLGE